MLLCISYEIIAAKIVFVSFLAVGVREQSSNFVTSTNPTGPLATCLNDRLLSTQRCIP